MEQKELPTVETCPCPHCVEARNQRDRLEELQITKVLVKVSTDNNCF